MQSYVKAEEAAMNYALRNASTQTGVATPEEALRLAELDTETVVVLYDGANLMALSKVPGRPAYQLGRGGLQFVASWETALMELARLSYPIRGAMLSRTVYEGHIEGQAHPLTLEIVTAHLKALGYDLKCGFDDHLGYWAEVKPLLRPGEAGTQAGGESTNRCESLLEAALMVCRQLHVEVL